MKVVIKIEEEIFEELIKYDKPTPSGNHLYDSVLLSIYNGIPLPENHGRIIDESKINQVYAYSEERIYNNIKVIHTTITHTDAPTIIEASGKESDIYDERSSY